MDWNEFSYRAAVHRCRCRGVTDTIEVGDPGSEAAHGYRIGTPTWTGTQTFVYPSQLSDTGRAHTGASQFTLAVDPGQPGPAARRMDHGIPDQRATVFVDGVTAGTWEDLGADGVHRWRDSSLALPPALTAGKSRITVRIEFASSWSGLERVHLLDLLHPDRRQRGRSATPSTSGTRPARPPTATRQWANLERHPRRGLRHRRAAQQHPAARVLGRRGRAQRRRAARVVLRHGPVRRPHRPGPAVGIDSGDTLYCYLPMPFGSRPPRPDQHARPAHGRHDRRGPATARDPGLRRPRLLPDPVHRDHPDRRRPGRLRPGHRG